MEVGQGVAELGGPGQDAGFGQETIMAPCFLDELAQVFARHEVHDEILAAVLLEEIGHFGEVGVVQPGQHAGLAIELLVRLVFHARPADQFR